MHIKTPSATKTQGRRSQIEMFMPHKSLKLAMSTFFLNEAIACKQNFS